MFARVLLSVVTVATLTAGMLVVEPVLAADGDRPTFTPRASGALQVARGDAGVVLGADALAPGRSVRGTVQLTSRGTAARVRLSASVTGDAALGRELRLVVRRGGTPVYAGPLSGLRDADGGRFAEGGATGTYTFVVSLPRVGNALQGRAVSAAFSWTASSDTGGPH